MKIKILIAVCFMFAMLSSNAQTRKDFECLNSQIDSVVSVYSTEGYKSSYNLYNIFYNVDITEKEKEKIIKKIEKMFMQNKYINLYTMGHYLIDEMWYPYPNANSTKTNQMLLELYLKYYFYPYRANDNLVDGFYYDLKRKENYTDKSKKRIIEILENNKMQKEFDLWLKYNKNIFTPSYMNLDYAKQIMKKREIQNDTILLQIQDSLLTDRVYTETKTSFELLQIQNPKLILIVGFLDMKECVPIMQKNLQAFIEAKQDDYYWMEYNYQRAYRFALAKLGDTIQRKYVLDNYMGIRNFDRNLFAYFRDDEMMWKFIEVNYHSPKTIPTDGNGGIQSYLRTMNDVYPFVENVSEYLVFPYMSNDMNEHYKWAKLFYEWLMENKQNIKFNYDGDKSEKWFW